MNAYTDRLIVTDIEVLGTKSPYATASSKTFKKGRILSAGDNAMGNSNQELEGKEFLFFDTAAQVAIPNETGKFLMRRNDIEILL